MPQLFQCSRTGMLYPVDYVEQWGRRYGIGLGSIPVSEALVNEYHCKMVINDEDPLKTMYPVAVCRAQVDRVEIPDDSPLIDPKSRDCRIAILAIEDPHMELRAEKMRERQREHSYEMKELAERIKKIMQN